MSLKTRLARGACAFAAVAMMVLPLAQSARAQEEAAPPPAAEEVTPATPAAEEAPPAEEAPAFATYDEFKASPE